jgi:hypothetical protein
MKSEFTAETLSTEFGVFLIKNPFLSALRASVVNPLFLCLAASLYFPTDDV